MAQDIELLGAVFNDVPAVELPQVGGGVATFTDTSDATLTDPAMLRTGNTAYSNGELITGTMADGSARMPYAIESSIASASVYNGRFVVTDTSQWQPVVTAGYIASGTMGNMSVALYPTNVTVLSATTYTPTTADQTIPVGRYTNGVQTIKGDANLLPENIKAGVSIFGVQGSSAVATATVSGTTLTLTDGFPVEVI